MKKANTTSTVDNEKQRISCDFITNCKSWKTALRRFGKAFKDTNSEIEGWVEYMKESAEGGCFSGNNRSDNDGNNRWSYGIEETSEGEWYIFLNISGVYAGFEQQETETSDEEVDAYINTLEAEEKQDQAITTAKTEIVEYRSISALDLQHVCKMYNLYTLAEKGQMEEWSFKVTDPELGNLTSSRILEMAKTIQEHSTRNPLKSG